MFQIHNFDKVQGIGVTDGHMKLDPRYRPAATVREASARLIMAASLGDIITCASLVERNGIGLLNMGDYDMRTPLHLAASENQFEVLAYFLSFDGVLLHQRDRWGARPVDDARKNGSLEVIQLLEAAMDKQDN